MSLQISIVPKQTNTLLFLICLCFSGLGDGGPPSGCSIQSQSSFDFCSPPTPSQTQTQAQEDPFQTTKDSSPFQETEVINLFSSNTGTYWIYSNSSTVINILKMFQWQLFTTSVISLWYSMTPHEIALHYSAEESSAVVWFYILTVWNQNSVTNSFQ